MKQTAEEFFRNKIKENIEWEGEITLWKVPLNAELSMRWAKEYSDYVIKWQKENSYSEEEVEKLIRITYEETTRAMVDWFKNNKDKTPQDAESAISNYVYPRLAEKGIKFKNK